MRVRCRHSGPEMVDSTSVLNLNTVNQLSKEKQELLKKFVEYLASDKNKNHDQVSFGKHVHGKHHGRYGHHGNHHGSHSHHGRCQKFSGFGRHGHGMHHVRYGHHGPHSHHGHHDLHNHHRGKFWAHWTVDLTDDEFDDNTKRVVEPEANPSSSPQENDSSNDKGQGAEEDKQCNCKCSRSNYPGRHHHGRFGRWRRSPYKRSEVSRTDNTSQNDGHIEETQDNLTIMEDNINIEHAE